MGYETQGDGFAFALGCYATAFQAVYIFHTALGVEYIHYMYMVFDSGVAASE